MYVVVVPTVGEGYRFGLPVPGQKGGELRAGVTVSTSRGEEP